MSDYLCVRGVFIDEDGVRWDSNNSDLEGWLWKQSRWVKGVNLSKDLFINI